MIDMKVLNRFLIERLESRKKNLLNKISHEELKDIPVQDLINSYKDVIRDLSNLTDRKALYE